MPNHYPEQNEFVTFKGGKFKFSAQDSDLAYFLSRIKLSDTKNNISFVKNELIEVSSLVFLG
jgi:hypothetical protein